MCEQVSKQILFQQCRYIESFGDAPRSTYFLNSDALFYVYVELRQVGNDVIIETVTSLEWNDRDNTRGEIKYKKSIFTERTKSFQAQRRAIQIFDDLVLRLDALSKVKQFA